MARHAATRGAILGATLAFAALGADPVQAVGIQPWISAEAGVFDTSPPPLPRDLVVQTDAKALTSGGTPVTASAAVATARGDALAQTTGGLLPSLKVRAATLTPDPGGSQPGRNAADGRAWLLGAYQHTGATSQTYNLTLDLSGVVAPDTGSSPLGDAILAAFASVYRTDVTIESQSIAGDDPELFLGFLAPNEIANGNLNLLPGQTNLTTGLSFTVSPGEKFYLYAGATALATNGVSVADGSNTLELVFDDTTNLQLVVDEIPEPASLLLLGAAAASLLVRVRRR